MEKFAIVMLGAIFVTLIVSSFQSLAAQNENDVMNSEYKIHLQIVVRDTNEQLVSVIESTNTKTLPTYLPDGTLVEGFIDYIFNQELQNNYQVITIDSTKYEKVVFRVHETTTFRKFIGFAFVFFFAGVWVHFGLRAAKMGPAWSPWVICLDICRYLLLFVLLHFGSIV